jgi:hypothetical protein
VPDFCPDPGHFFSRMGQVIKRQVKKKIITETVYLLAEGPFPVWKRPTGSF